MVLEGFHEVRFPLRVAFGATGGPERRTEVISLASGFEERNARWASSRRRYDAGDGIRSRDDLHTVIEFFEERRGRLYGFRYTDPVDHASCRPNGRPSATDQAIGEGDGATATFPLVKRYGGLHAPYEREIAKPVAGSVVVAVAGAEKVEGADFTVSPTTGEVTFLAHAIPGPGEPVTAGFLFDTPVRFDTDRLEINLRSFDAGMIPSIPIVEIRL
jgi:uncharacterized protein (TIGR02217 family)